jgi:hypothetical protein
MIQHINIPHSYDTLSNTTHQYQVPCILNLTLMSTNLYSSTFTPIFHINIYLMHAGYSRFLFIQCVNHILFSCSVIQLAFFSLDVVAPILFLYMSLQLTVGESLFAKLRKL